MQTTPVPSQADLYAALQAEIGVIDVAMLMEKTDRSIKAMAYKTVEVFAGIKQRKLYLKDAGRGGRAATNGYLIEVPFMHPRAYQYVEHELSHILFDSNALVRNTFIEEYAKKAEQVAIANKCEVEPRVLRLILSHLIGILDDERVISLWGSMYKGSAAIMRQMKFDDYQALLARGQAPQNLMGLFYAVAARSPVAGDDPKVQRYLPYFQEALRKVQGRDYHSVLVAAKWLLTYLIAEIIREARKLPPPPPILMPAVPKQPAGAQSGSPDDTDEDGEEPSDGEDGDEGDLDEAEIASEGVSGTAGGEDEEETGGAEASSDAEGEGEGEDARPEPWQPPATDADVAERSQALEAFLQMCEGGLQEPPEEVSESKYKPRDADARANAQATAALKEDIRDEANLEAVLGRSERRMQELIQEALEAMRNDLTEDERIRRDAMAAVKFSTPEIKDSELTPLNDEDLETIQRLRARFIRIMGRQTQRLDDAGTEIDIPAYIARRLTHEDVPVFRSLESGRGFQSLILVDRSGSMFGEPTEQADRACRVIARALRFPFVTTDVWGFQSLSEGEVNIQRHQRGADYLGGQVGGTTPLHTAIRLGAHHLEVGSDCKQLFVITDGQPVFARKGGGSYNTKNLIEYVRGEVQHARSRGIGVIGVLLGDGMDPALMRYMFGMPKYWRLMDPQSFGNSLIQLVSEAFTDYLRYR